MSSTLLLAVVIISNFIYTSSISSGGGGSGSFGTRSNSMMADQKPQPEKKWFPLESNPSLLNQYISKLGFETTSHEFADVLSTEQWALDMVPHPVSAVVVLFPMTSKVSEKRRELHTKSLHSSGSSTRELSDSSVWYIKQRISNSCGTIAILHALMNVPKTIQETSIRQSSWLHTFMKKCPTSLSPVDKAILLENDTTIETYHEDATHEGQTSRPNLDENIDLHFITFIHNNGKLYELDGRVEHGPICHGDTTQQSLLKDACNVVKQLMEADPSEVRFTIIALAPKVD